MAVRRNQGFSFVELVVAIVVLGIIAAVTMSRFIRSDTYNPAITRDQVISLARSAQQKSIGRSDVTLTVQPVNDVIEIRLDDGQGQVQISRVDLPTVEMRADVNQLASCSVTAGGTAVTNGAPLVLKYDSLGDLISAVTGTTPGSEQNVTTAVRLCINDSPAMSVCWSPSGFAYAGDCLP
jgi:prepilin-type N-terminal cleavage/methylation domain-containing protein